MFETSQVHAHALSSARHARFFTGSIAVHTLAIAGAVIASVASVDFPSHAPDQLAVLQLVARVDLPPAGPRAVAPPRQQAAAQPPRQQTAPVAPETIPDQVTPVETSASSNISDTPVEGDGRDVPGEEGGVSDGIPGGLPGAGSGARTGTTQEGPLVVGGEVLAPRVLTRVTPEFPAIAARAGMKGVVVVECIIDRQGNVRDVRVLHSSFAAFEQSAISAVRQWKFAPGTYRGNPVATVFNLTVTFSVNNAR